MTTSPVSSRRPVSILRGASAMLALALMATAPAFATKYASIVVDMDTGEVLHQKNADDARYPASLTKVMTLYIVFDALESGKLKLTDKMKVSKFAARQSPSKLGLKAGTTIKVQDAIRALVTKSANDVAVVFAEHMSGSEAKFAVRMTSKAKALGLEHTTFKNASGLPNKAQTSTARDLAKLAEAMFFDHREYYNYFSTPEFTWKKRHFANHNTLLKSVEGVDGIKTGFTNASGYNLMASAERDTHRVIAVMLGGSSGRSRDQHVADLLNAAFYQIKGESNKPEAVALLEKISFGEAAEAAAPIYMTMADKLAAAQLKQFASAEEESTDEGDNGTGDDADAPDGEDTAPVENDDADTPTPAVDSEASKLLLAAAPAPAEAPISAPMLTAAPALSAPVVPAPTLAAASASAPASATPLASLASSLTSGPSGLHPAAPAFETARVETSSTAALPSLAPPVAAAPQPAVAITAPAPTAAPQSAVATAAPQPEPVVQAVPSPPVFQQPILESSTPKKVVVAKKPVANKKKAGRR